MEELKIMVKVEGFRLNAEINEHENHQKYSQYVIRLLGCGLTPPDTQWPFLVIEYADVSKKIGVNFSLSNMRKY